MVDAIPLVLKEISILQRRKAQPSGVKSEGSSLQVKASWPELTSSASSLLLCCSEGASGEASADDPLGLAERLGSAKLILVSSLIIFWRGKESNSFFHCSAQCAGKSDGGEAVEKPASSLSLW